MKVNDPKLANLSATEVGAARGAEAPAGKQKAGDVSQKSGGDQVSLSELSSQLRSLNSQSADRAAYLEKLSSDVESGRYAVDSKAVAKQMIDEALKDRGPNGIG